MADMNKAGTPKQAPIVPGFTPKQHVGVGGEILSAEPIEYNEGRYTAKIVVHNTGDRPIQYRPQDREACRAQYRRPPDSGRFAFPFLRSEPVSRIRPGKSFRLSPEYSGNNSYTF